MNMRARLNFRDCLFLLGTVLFFVGCIATTHRSPKTLEPGEVSIGGSYLQANNLDESGEDPIRLISVDGRVGVVRGFDLGFTHAWDVSKDSDDVFATYWGDFKAQLTNRDNIELRPIISTGLMKGYVYHEDAKIHITTLPIMLGLPLNEYFTPYFIYRIEFLSDDFLPDDFEEPRHTFVLGVETELGELGSTGINPKLGLSIGTFNSITGGEGDNGLILNAGLSFDISIR